jgi:T5SS/PEP-CTERM-associated repeat protein
MPSEATITGPGSQWNNNGRLFVGNGGSNGVLTVADGGLVTAGTLYASLGDLHGDGTITASKRAILDADLLFDATQGSQTAIGFGTGGTLNVTAAGGDLGAGFKSLGSLTVADGVVVSSSNGYLGLNSSSVGKAAITGPGSKWINSQDLSIGQYGDGALRVEAGGQVTNTHARVGFDTGSVGAATITGSGAKWTSSFSLTVGAHGSGTLGVEAGGQVSNSDGYLGAFSGGIGAAVVTGSDSKWTNTGRLYVGRSGKGTLAVVDGGLASVGNRLTIDDDSFINIATGGMLALAGDAARSLSEFLGLISGTDAIRYWDASLADWSPLTAATYGTDYTLKYLTTGDLAGYTLLTVGRVGDFDNDGDVDGRDLLAWQRHPELGSLADWQDAYGSIAPSAAAAVPEPSSLGLLLGLMLLSGRVRASQVDEGKSYTSPWSFGL